MNREELRKEWEKKSGFDAIECHGRVSCAYTEHIEDVVIRQAEEIDRMKAKLVCPKNCKNYDYRKYSKPCTICRREFKDQFTPKEETR